MYIKSADKLRVFCDNLQSAEVLVVDTEFVREKTYFHRIGLIQVGGGEHFAAIDPIALSDLTPLIELLKDPNKTKVFHAARQDLEILVRLCGQVIPPVFDTQIAAALVGWGTQISFAKIVFKALGKKIHKSETYTDWCRRPLSDNQIEYAINDVRYLMPVYEKLIERLIKMDRLEWIRGEVLDWEDPKTFALPDPQKRFMKIKNLRSLKPRNLTVLQKIAAWREGEAVNRDCLAKSIIRDDTLLEIARKIPRDIKTISAIRGLYQKELSKCGVAILNAIESAMEIEEADLVELTKNNGHATTRGVEELIAAYVQIRSEELKIEPSVLADRKKIHSFVSHFELIQVMDEHILFQGWRKELIGIPMLSLLSGKMGLKIDPSGQVRLISS